MKLLQRGNLVRWASVLEHLLFWVMLAPLLERKQRCHYCSSPSSSAITFSGWKPSAKFLLALVLFLPHGSYAAVVLL